jgi:antitoxin VapB
MALHIRSERADRLAREVAARTGETLTDAVIQGLELRLKQAEKRPTKTARKKRTLEQMLAELDALPILDGRHPDEIIGYDENGLPT